MRTDRLFAGATYSLYLGGFVINVTTTAIFFTSSKGIVPARLRYPVFFGSFGVSGRFCQSHGDEIKRAVVILPLPQIPPFLRRTECRP